MKHFFILLLSLWALMVSPISGHAQLAPNLSAIKTAQLSDAQIMQLWQQVQKKGMGENDALNLLMKQGLSLTEANALKKRIHGLGSPMQNSKLNNKLIRDTGMMLRDTLLATEIPLVRKPSAYYGFDFFSNPDANFTPDLRVTNPGNYVLGTGDELNIGFSGLNQNEITAMVDASGKISLPYAGMLSLGGLTLSQATERVKNKMSVAYPALKSGGTKVYLSLENYKTIRVSVIGEAQRPGNYVVSSLASFFNVLYKSGGPSEQGSLRKIEIIRNNQLLETVDFYQFLQKGLLGKNIRLEDQDIIRFPLYQKRVRLQGSVKRPLIYELLEKETLSDLLNFAGGLSDGAVKEMARLVQKGDKEMQVRDIAASDFSYFILRDGDQVLIDQIAENFTNRISLVGAVYRPGNYELTPGLSLGNLLKKANGLLEHAFSNRSYLTRRNAQGERSFLSFNTQAILQGTAEDILLAKDDSVFILSKDGLEEIPSITVGGNVRNPITIPYKKGMRVEDALLLAGGFSNDAATHKVTISRQEKNRADTLANQLIEVMTLEVDASLANLQSKHFLEPMDYVFVPRLLNYYSLGTVKIQGEVLYQGDYTLEKRNETLPNLIQRAGGLSPFASLANAQVYRKGLRMSTTHFLLQAGDSIFIPKNEPFVEIQGAVFNPQIVSYHSDRFLNYLSDVGGIKDNGNLKKAYIQYPNGINNKIKHFLFFRIYPKVKPGSKIMVPEKTEQGKKGLSVFEFSTLLGSLATLISLVAVLKN